MTNPAGKHTSAKCAVQQTKIFEAIMTDNLKLEDRQLITDKLYNYSWTIDHNDVSGWLDTFTDDTFFKFGELEIRGKENLGQWISSEVVGTLLNMRHIITNIMIEFEGENEALSKSYWIFNSGHKEHKEEGVTENANGKYLMKWRSDKDGWQAYETMVEAVWWTGYNA